VVPEIQVLFTAEMMLKMIISGFVLHTGSYLREPWNRIDFFIVIMSWVNYAPRASNMQALRVVRVLRPFVPRTTAHPLRRRRLDKRPQLDGQPGLLAIESEL
jgi:hypothetical protein